MNGKIAQYKGRASEEFWSNKFINYNIEDKIQEVKKSRLFRIIKSKLDKRDKVLEIGCGMGKISLSLLEAGYDVFGVDYSKRLIKKIKESKPNFKNKFKFMDGRKLLFKEGSFDKVISPGVIEHFHEEEQRIMLAECHRVLNSEGRLICIVPYMSLVKRLRYSSIQKKYNKLRDNGVEFYQYVYSEKEIKNLLNKNKFSILNVELLGLHDTRLFGKKIIPKFMQNNALLLKIFGTTICLTCSKL